MRAVPAPGFRDAGYYSQFGELKSGGNDGYSWGSSVSGASAVGLYFNYGGVGLSYTYYRAYGFPVRCLRAFTDAGRSLLFFDDPIWVCRMKKEHSFSL